MAILITGGARSGKSSFAERLARTISSEGIYIATGIAFDDEMKDRIQRHRQDREAQTNMGWTTVEEPYALAEWLRSFGEAWTSQERNSALSPDHLQLKTMHTPIMNSETIAIHQADHSENPTDSKRTEPVVLIDCITLWLTNHLLREEEDADADVEAEMDKLVDAITNFPLPLLMVTNEVGGGIVPSYPLGRRFRDEAGRLNQRVAAVCERVFLVTSGIPIDLRSIAFRFEDES